jgi:hypothetical protein
MPAKRIYNSKKAEQKLNVCLQDFRAQHEEIVDILREVRKQLTETRIDRLWQVLAPFLLKVENADFLSSYFEKCPNDINAFVASRAVRTILEEGRSEEFIPILSEYTLRDLKTQKLETLFRVDCLSSSLCKEYALFLWEKDLKVVKEAIARIFKANSPLTCFCLNKDIVTDSLKSQIALEQFDLLSQDRVVEAMQIRHAKNLCRLAGKMLPVIYALKVPTALSQLFAKRRSHIIQFLKQTSPNQGEDFHAHSRIYIAELVYLRILNPTLLKVGDGDQSSDVLLSLTKIMQCLASEAPFGTEKKNIIYEGLNPLFHQFLPLHRAFLDQNSLLADLRRSC